MPAAKAGAVQAAAAAALIVDPLEPPQLHPTKTRMVPAVRLTQGALIHATYLTR